MDSLPNTICKEIAKEMDDTEKTDEHYATDDNENFADANSKDIAGEDLIKLELVGNAESVETGVVGLFINDILEKLIEKAVSADGPCDSDDTEEIVCTEIFDDTEKLDKKNETPTADDLNSLSSYDLFKEAYGSWGREDTVEFAAKNSEFVEKNADAEDVVRDTDTVIQNIEQSRNSDSDSNIEIDSQEDNSDGFDENLTFEAFYKSFVDDLNLHITSEEELDFESPEETSSLSQFLDEDIFVEDSENEVQIVGAEESTSEPRQKVCRRSARLASQLFSDLGSVEIKTEKVDSVKIVLRMSARLEGKRKNKEEEDGNEKKSKKN